MRNRRAQAIASQRCGRPHCHGETTAFDDDLPAVMIGENEGVDLRMPGATTASASATFQEFVIEKHKDILAGFSSQGPTNTGCALKPDVTSVGVNVFSSITCVRMGLLPRHLNVDAADCRIGCCVLAVASRLVACAG